MPIVNGFKPYAVSDIAPAPGIASIDAWGEGHQEQAVTQRVEAVRVLYHTEGRAIFQFLRRLLRDQALASDALQETFARALTGYDRLRDRRRVRGWLFGVARHVASEYRKERRRVGTWELGEDPAELARYVGDHLDPEQLARGGQRLRALRDALDALGEDKKAALSLRVEHGLEYTEIAAAMGWSLSKAKVEVMRARRRLRRLLERDWGEEA